MPRNVTGGSGHRAQRNSEGSKARNNRCLGDDLIDDYNKNEKTEGVFVARVTRRMGSGRMEVFFVEEREDEDEGTIKTERTMIMPMRGGLRGKGKKAVWVEVDSIVMVAETELSGITHEIVSVFSEEQVAKLKKAKPDLDPRLFIKTSTGGVSESLDEQGGVEFTNEVDVDAI